MSMAPWAEEIPRSRRNGMSFGVGIHRGWCFPERKQATIIAVPALRFRVEAVLQDESSP